MTEISGAMTSPPVAVDPLALRALSGDRGAEREVCRRILPAVRAFAQRRLRGSAADDFAQDAIVLFVEALRGGRIDDPTRLAAFALGVCRNLARDRARAGERRRELAQQFLTDDPASMTWEPNTSVRRDHLEDCLSQLNARTRRVMHDTFCSDGTDAEIAGALSLTEANVRVIRHRALAALRDCLEKPISWVRP